MKFNFESYFGDLLAIDLFPTITLLLGHRFEQRGLYFDWLFWSIGFIFGDK